MPSCWLEFGHDCIVGDDYYEWQYTRVIGGKLGLFQVISKWVDEIMFPLKGRNLIGRCWEKRDSQGRSDVAGVSTYPQFRASGQRQTDAHGLGWLMIVSIIATMCRDKISMLAAFF